MFNKSGIRLLVRLTLNLDFILSAVNYNSSELLNFPIF